MCFLLLIFTFDLNTLLLYYIMPHLTYELISFVQPGKQFLTVVVVNWDAHKVALADKVWLGAGVTGIQHIGDTILGHQIL